MAEVRKPERVGMLFSGGPAPAANAVISAAVMNFVNAGIEVYGFLDGYFHLAGWTRDEPLVEKRDYRRLRVDDVSGIRHEGAIVLRTSRSNPGKAIKSREDLLDPEKSAGLLAVHGALRSLGVDALISIGGDDTLKTANYLFELQKARDDLEPISLIHLPKTIDNDYYGIDWTFGFTSAADFAAREIRNLIADAKSTSSWWILELMGRKAGWLTYAAGIAGTATKMISVEDVAGDFDVDACADEIVDLMTVRKDDGRCYGAVCIAEGLADRLPDDQRPTEVDLHGNVRLGKAEVGRMLAERVQEKADACFGDPMKVRHKQIGYETRCNPPSAFDVLLGSQLGVGSYRALVERGLSGVMVSVEGQLGLKYVPFDELIDPATFRTRVRFIERDSDFYKLARALEYQRQMACDE
jgi:6-phosphofructokinase 1